MFQKNNYLHFILLAFLSILFTLEFNIFIQTDEIIAKNLSEKYTQEMIANYLNIRSEWSWVIYIFILFSTYITTSLIALIILLVIELYYINKNKPNINFKDTWNIALTAQWTNVAILFVNVIWFGFYHTKYSLDELRSFSPLSLINLFDRKTLDVWLIYPIQLINIFELTYWFILIIKIKQTLKINWLKAIEIFFLSYGIALIVWVVIIMFATLNFSQL